MKINDMRIGTRLVVSSALVLALLLMAAVFGVVRIEQLQQRIKEVHAINDAETQLASELRHAVMDIRVSLGNVAMLSDAAAKQQEAEQVRSELARYAQSAHTLQDMFATVESTHAEQHAWLAKASEKSAAAIPMMTKALELGLENRNDEAIQVLMQELQPSQKEWVSALDALIGFEERVNEQAVADIDRDYHNARLLIVCLIVVVVICAAFLTRVITRSITVPIADAVHLAETVAAGDLTCRIESASADETGRLLAALRDMNAGLARIVSEVRSGTESIATASGQIASGNLDLSARTEQQAASLEETASSMEELTSTVKQNADNARQASQFAASASQIAIKGGEVVAQVVDTMDAIHSSSRKIVDIIAVIDGIAFQTNILALNAAVEAARAGEQGRGFAVVAGEVRTLAQRSAGAAKEIKALIDDSVTSVNAGTALVAEAGTTISEVVSSVKRVTDFVNEIAASSQEQSAGIEQVNQAIGHMDQVTQQNAALVEEATAAAAALNDQARRLSQVVGTFRIIDMPGLPTAAADPCVETARPSALHQLTANDAAGLSGPQRRRLFQVAVAAREGVEAF